MPGTLSISAPDHNLVEAGVSDSVGVAAASVSLAISDSDGIDLSGWTARADGLYVKATTYGQAVLDTSANTLTYALDNQRSATQLLREGDTFTDPVTVSLMGGASAQATFTVVGHNDAPTIVASSGSATGQLTVTDPDRLSTVLLSVQGGTSSYVPEAFHVTAASFSVTKNGALLFSDTFSDGNPPPSAPNFANNTSAAYSTIGPATEAGGRLVLDSTSGGSLDPIGTTQPRSGFIDTLQTNTDGSSTAGLKEGASFQVTGVFDFTLPTHPRELYGIRLTDNTSTHAGNDLVELDVRQDGDGSNHVELRALDAVSNTSVTLASSAALSAVSAGDRIALHLNHDAAAADPTTITATYEIIHNGIAGATQTLSAAAHVFNGETFTRAGINAYAPVDTDSALAGAYGTLHVNQKGVYTYDPSAAASSIADGTTVRDPFTIVATDEHGATTTHAITISVTGTSSGVPVIALATDSKVADGYVAGATVFADANGNGVLDAGEASTTTDANGNYTLVGGSGPLVATGGTDIATGLPLAFTLTAPAGSTVITPLTTLIQDLGGTADAAGKVAAAFGVSSNTNLLAFDPVAAVQSSGTDGNAAYLAGVAVANVVSLIGSALAGVGADAHAAGTAVLSTLATKVAALGQGATLDLSDTALLTSTISGASSTLGLGTDATTVTTLAKLVSGTVADLASVAGQSGQSLIDAASSKATVVQGELSQAVMQSHGSADALQNAVDSYGPTAEHLNPIYRFYDTVTNDHFYTMDPAEKASIQANLPTFTYEGTPWVTPDKGADTHDVFRFYDTVTKAHFLTDSVAERDAVLSTLPTFTYEGVAFEAYNAPQNGNEYALERFYNTNSKVHTYAADAAEIALIKSGAVGQGWVDEGASFVVHAPVHDVLSA